jgi:hypothetical protein
MNREKQLKLIITKEESIKRQMDELRNILNYQSKTEEYRNFNNIFISSVRTFKEIVNSLNLKADQILYHTECEVKIADKLNCMKKLIIDFIDEIINVLKKRSEHLTIYDKESSKKYKYIQQIIDDYIKLLLYIE